MRRQRGKGVRGCDIAGCQGMESSESRFSLVFPCIHYVFEQASSPHLTFLSRRRRELCLALALALPPLLPQCHDSMLWSRLRSGVAGTAETSNDDTVRSRSHYSIAIQSRWRLASRARSAVSAASRGPGLLARGFLVPRAGEGHGQRQAGSVRVLFLMPSVSVSAGRRRRGDVVLLAAHVTRRHPSIDFHYPIFAKQELSRAWNFACRVLFIRLRPQPASSCSLRCEFAKSDLGYQLQARSCRR